MKAIALWLLVVGVVLGVWLSYFLSSKMQQPFLVDTSRATVIKEIQNLQRLETAQFTLEKVIDAKTTGPEWQQLLFGDRLLLIAHARVIAGVDMAKISEQDIVIQDKKITITLPPSEIFISDLDESKTQVYDRQKGLLTKGEDQLESQARQAAEQTMMAAACEGEILSTAAENAKKQLEKLLGALGFTDVIVAATTGTC